MSHFELSVIFFELNAFKRVGGAITKETQLDLRRVVDVMPSPKQLPPEFAERSCNKGGASFMGGIDFTLTMKDGTRFYYSLGNICEFIIIQGIWAW